MTWKTVLSMVFFIVAVTLLVFYWIIPLDKIEFGSFNPSHSNFTLNSSTEENMHCEPIIIEAIKSQLSIKVGDRIKKFLHK